MKSIKEVRKYTRYKFIQLSSITVLPSVIRKVYELIKYKLSVGGNVSVVILCEHIGDIIACEPVSRYLKEKKNSKVVWVVKKNYKDILTMFRDVDKIITVESITEAIYLKALIFKCDIYNLHLDGRACTKYPFRLHNHIKVYTTDNYYHYGSILETFSETGGLPRLKQKPQLKLESKDLFPDINSPIVSIQIESNEECRMWGIEKWEELIKNNPQTTFFEIGLKSYFSHLPNCISSYCGKLLLSDIPYIIRKSSVFVGIDSSVAHFANALNIPSLILLGKYRGFSYYNPYAVCDDNFVILHCSDLKELPVITVQSELNKILSKVNYNQIAANYD